MEEKLKYLEFIQNIITRKNTNSFLIKGWVITLLTGLFVLSAANSNSKFVIIAYFIIPAFWALDSYYLSLERKFRKLYNDVIKDNSEIKTFSLDISSYENFKFSWVSTFFSITIIVFYGVCFGATIAVINLLK
jgi:hypothetical protein